MKIGKCVWVFVFCRVFAFCFCLFLKSWCRRQRGPADREAHPGLSSRPKKMFPTSPHEGDSKHIYSAALSLLTSLDPLSCLPPPLEAQQIKAQIC